MKNTTSTSAASTSAVAPAAMPKRMIRGAIADSSGHTDFNGTAEEAVELIKENVEKHNKWVFLGNEPVFPQGDADYRAIRERMENGEVDEFTVTAKLMGGINLQTVKVATGLTDKIGRRRSNPQLVLTLDGERKTAKLLVSNRKNVLPTLQTMKGEIIEAIDKALS